MDVDQLAAQYINIITEILNSTAPLKTMHLRERPGKAWYDDDCRRSRKEARRKEIQVKQKAAILNGMAQRTTAAP